MDRRFKVVRTDTHKQCAICKDMVPLEGFSKASAERDGLYYCCRECNKARRKEAYQNGQGQQIKAERDAMKEFYIKQFGGKCVRCGYNEFMAALDFHHVRDKIAAIGHLITWAILGKGNPENIVKLEAELAKCILLCSNCHGALHGSCWSLEGEQFEPKFNPTTKSRDGELSDLPLFN